MDIDYKDIKKDKATREAIRNRYDGDEPSVSMSQQIEETFGMVPKVYDRPFSEEIENFKKAMRELSVYVWDMEVK